MKVKKIPLRTCCVTKERLPKEELFRVVKNKEGQVFVDETRKANGRGAYLKKDIAILEQAQKQKLLNKHLEVEVPDSIYEKLKQIV